MSDDANEAARKEAFDRQKVCYEQNFQQFRAMNQIMWQVPVLAMTLTGGLWFAAVNVRGMDGMQVPLLLLAAVFDIAFIFVLIRIRHVMEAYLQKLRDFCPAGFVEAPGTSWYNRSRTVVRAFSTALSLAALGGLAGSGYFGWSFLFR